MKRICPASEIGWHEVSHAFPLKWKKIHQGVKATIESLSSKRSWGHKRWPEVTHASVCALRMPLSRRGQVTDARTPLLKFKIEREMQEFKSLPLGKNCLVISEMAV